ncbi:MAG: cytochrome b/b6 domain-containing protein [Bryobacterales bacterium]|nr:cytochrome b/b6 domain-containing protein [Bryobacteraceae bacterium]MDW8131960.1 cytochrome b/b6 domain-containing protein [Bryobacterales bacterium]
MRRGLRTRLWALWLAAAGWAQPVADCSACHEQGKTLANSAHAQVRCQQCHPGRETYPHPKGLRTVGCESCHAEVVGDQRRSVHAEAAKRGEAAPTCDVCHGGVHEVKFARSAEFHRQVPELCGMCHSRELEQFKESVHGTALARGAADAPVCTSCHGEHAILPPSRRDSLVAPARVPETCGQCHGNLRLNRRYGLPADRVVSFEASFHGLAAKAGSQTVANCASCHGWHDVLPSSDPKSRIHPRNLARTCGECHPGAGQRFALGPIHVIPGSAEPSAVRWARIFYRIVIPLTIGFMLVHNLGDWVRKLRRKMRGMAPLHTAASLRMLPAERIQHALLASSFIVLVWTGFALRYPEQWWAQILVRWESAFPVRGTVHRIAAVVLMATAVLHVITLVTSRRLRHRWQELWPNRRDVREAIAQFAYNLGLSNRRPLLSEHSYIEKIEYWAVVWGTAVMVVTGIALWAHDWMLAHLPKSVLDFAATVHFYEAVLAALAILVWHFYVVIFDPDVYPMDTAWLTGWSPRPRLTGRHREQSSQTASEQQATLTTASQEGEDDPHA